MRGEIRPGRVSSVDSKKHTVKVRFFEGRRDDNDTEGGFVSDDLPMMFTRRGDYSLPAKDDPVLCFIGDGFKGVGYCLGLFYNDADAPPTDDKARRVVAGDDVRLGAFDASDKVALAPATKDQDQKVLDYAKGIASAIQAGVVVAQDGGASLKATIVAALPIPPTLDAPAAEKVSAK